MTCLGVEEISWPKNLSVRPEVTKQTGGLDEAQPAVQVPLLKKGSLVKPSFLQVKFDAQSTWVIDESSRGYLSGDSESPESAAVRFGTQCLCPQCRPGPWCLGGLTVSLFGGSLSRCSGKCDGGLTCGRF